MIERLCIIGVGLIGGSLARALRDAAAVRDIIGAGRSRERLQKAVDLGVIDGFNLDVAAAVKGADVVVVAVPLGAFRGVLQTILPALDPRAVVTDVGSAKQCVIADVEAVAERLPPWFVPGHPIAGTEESGVEASQTDLFKGRRVLLTPTGATADSAVATVTQLWEAAGATVGITDPRHHDTVLAATSHLPHLLAYQLVDCLAALGDRKEIFAYAAGGFEDFTRIASSDPVMWRDICLANRQAIVDILRKYVLDLEQLMAAVEAGESAKILDKFSRAKEARDMFIGRVNR